MGRFSHTFPLCSSHAVIERLLRRSAGMTVSAMNESVINGSTPRETPS